MGVGHDMIGHAKIAPHIRVSSRLWYIYNYILCLENIRGPVPHMWGVTHGQYFGAEMSML